MRLRVGGGRRGGGAGLPEPAAEEMDRLQEQQQKGKGDDFPVRRGLDLAHWHVHSNVPQSVGGGAGSPSQEGGRVQGSLVVVTDDHWV